MLKDELKFEKVKAAAMKEGAAANYLKELKNGVEMKAYWTVAEAWNKYPEAGDKVAAKVKAFRNKEDDDDE